MILFGYTLYDDYITHYKGRMNWHSLFLKAAALSGSTGNFFLFIFYYYYLYHNRLIY